MKEISLTRGLVALVDDEDYERINAFKWCCMSTRYAGRFVRRHPEKRLNILMHREVLRLSSGGQYEVDHIDSNKLNNQKVNLRICNRSENSRNKGLRPDNKSGFKGVSFDKTNQKWVAYINLNKRRHSLGYFRTPEDAHAAYCAAARKLHGEFARLE